MTQIKTFNTRSQRVRAMRIILGATTKTDILQFCPNANVGVTLNTDLIDDEKDICWVVAPSGTHQRAEMIDDGDWLVEFPDGRFAFLSDQEFNRQYEAHS